MGAGGCGEGAGKFRPGAPGSDDTIRPPMNETARDVSAAGSVGAVPSRGSLLGPTVAFALYLTHAAAAAILLVAAFRIFSDRKSTRLNSSHGYISYAVFCLKKKKRAIIPLITRHEQPNRG